MNPKKPENITEQVKKNKPMVIAIGVSLLLIMSIAGYWHHRKLHPTTNDAYVQADVIDIAPQVTGAISMIYVKDHQQVQQGDVLFDIDPTPYNNAVAQAQANLESIRRELRGSSDDIQAIMAQVKLHQAELVAAQSNANRILKLVKKKILSEAKGDEALSRFKVAQAALAAAKNQLHSAREKLGDAGVDNPRYQAAQAALKQAVFNLDHTHVRAPANGKLVNFKLRQGAVVNANQPLFSLIEDQSWWVVANFKETDIGRIQPNQPAHVRVDMYPNIVFDGIVESISAGSGAAFSLLPPENATGNWVKVTQRFPVRIKLVQPDSEHPLRPLRLGASSEVTIDTNAKTPAAETPA